MSSSSGRGKATSCRPRADNVVLSSSTDSRTLPLCAGVTDNEAMGDELVIGGFGVRVGAGGTLRRELLPRWLSIASSLAQHPADQAVVTWMAESGPRISDGTLVVIENERAFQNPLALEFFQRVLAAHAKQLSTPEYPLPQLLLLHELLSQKVGRPAPEPPINQQLDADARDELAIRLAELRLSSMRGSQGSSTEEMLRAFDEYLALVRLQRTSRSIEVGTLIQRAEWCVGRGLTEEAVLTYQRLAVVDEEASDRAMWAEIAESMQASIK